MSPGEKSPLLSIVVITRDRCESLALCLASLMDQDVDPQTYEIIVVDDGSKDDTAATVTRFRCERTAILSIRQEATGIAAARNLGWRHASGTLVAFVADDYELPRDYVGRVLAFFNRFPAAAAVRFRIDAAGDDLCSRVSHFYFDVEVRNNLHCLDRPGRMSLNRAVRKFADRLPEHGSEPTVDHTLSASGAAAFRVDALQTLGGFDERLVRSEDTDLARRMRFRGLALYYDPTLSIRRTYRDSFRDGFRTHLAAAYHLARYESHRAAVSSTHRFVWTLLKLPFRPLWRARQARSPRESLFLLPFLYFLEVAHCVGFLAGTLGVGTNRAKIPRERLAG